MRWIVFVICVFFSLAFTSNQVISYTECDVMQSDGQLNIQCFVLLDECMKGPKNNSCFNWESISCEEMNYSNPVPCPDSPPEPPLGVLPSF